MPLQLKFNSKTGIPSAIGPPSPLNGTVDDAVRLGADAAGYTLHIARPPRSGRRCGKSSPSTHRRRIRPLDEIVCVGGKATQLSRIQRNGLV